LYQVGFQRHRVDTAIAQHDAEIPDRLGQQGQEQMFQVDFVVPLGHRFGAQEGVPSQTRAAAIAQGVEICPYA
jgi:hypothetical protein